MPGNNNYAAKLRDPRWQKKRLEIFERDNWTCQNCGDKKQTLVVHHKMYLPGLEPWEYPSKYLTTFCSDCHPVKYMQPEDYLDEKLSPREVFILRETHYNATKYLLSEAQKRPVTIEECVHRTWKISVLQFFCENADKPTL